MRCAIWYHLYNLENVKNTHGGMLLLVKLQAKNLFSSYGFVCLLVAVHHWKKIIENCNSVVAEVHKVGKVVFGLILTIILPIFGERKKGKFYILKKVGLSTFKEIF